MPKFKEKEKDKNDKNLITKRPRSRSAVGTLKMILNQEHAEKISTQEVELEVAYQKINNLEHIISKMQQDMSLLQQQIIQQPQQQIIQKPQQQQIIQQPQQQIIQKPQQQQQQQQQKHQQKQQQKQQQHQQIEQMLQQQKIDQLKTQRLQQLQNQPQPSTSRYVPIENEGIPTNNSFLQLQEDTDEETHMEDSRTKMDQDFPTLGSRQNPKPSLQNNSNKKMENAPEKLPPIHINGMRGQQIIEILRNINIKQYSIRKTGLARHLLQMIDIDDFRIVQTKLKNLSVPHFTYTPKQNRNKVYLLRGLDGDEDPVQILEELKSLNITMVEFITVSKFNTKQKSNSLFLIQISPNSNEQNLFKTNKVNNTIVKWESIKKRDIIQCFRCQRLGHSAFNCGMDYRCVKCKENDHDPGQCQLPKGVQHDTHKVYCVSCQAFGHPASYRGCPKIKDYVQSRKFAQKKDKTNKVNQTEFANSVVKRGVTYSIATNPQNQNFSRTVGAEKRSELDALKAFLTQTIAELSSSIHTKLTTLSNSIQDVSARTDFIYDNFCQNV